ncbi:hypothetical protein TRIP_B330564 [uncultured Desulfatiglans sp.]|uniref:Uroporphyrinogen decarboxylase (URO-D) domain-containing protein n=1 Tax=Uncultured Desulfatiglans sp. TaxID=1748965 RepID=A0A653A929_UNCDX|nr:hypothetical protein TRIP_B330564 [uncultured Desulfatiglans sp.]
MGKKKSPKRLWKDLFDHKALQRPLFIPLVYSYASRIGRMPFQEMLSDSTRFAKALMSAQELFGYDAVLSHYDPYLELELLGRSFEWVPKGVKEMVVSSGGKSAVTDRKIIAAEVPPVNLIFDAAAEMREVIGQDIPVIGVVNSPVTLLRAILRDRFSLKEADFPEAKVFLNDIQGIVLDLVKAYCNLRVDAIWLIEEDWEGIEASEVERIKPIYQTFWNVLDYFDVRSIMAFHRYDIAELETYFSIGADAVFFAGAQAYDIELEKLSVLMERNEMCAGVACPFPDSADRSALFDSILSQVMDAGSGFFLSTPLEVALDTPIESLTEMVERITEP